MSRWRLSREWRDRLLGGVVVAVVGYGAAILLDFDPRPLPYVLWSATALAACWLALDTLDLPMTSWRTSLPPRADRADEAGSDLRVLTGHQQASEPSAALRDRLVVLARGRDPDLAAALSRELDPVRRLSPADIDRILTRIEDSRD